MDWPMNAKHTQPAPKTGNSPSQTNRPAFPLLDLNSVSNELYFSPQNISSPISVNCDNQKFQSNIPFSHFDISNFSHYSPYSQLRHPITNQLQQPISNQHANEHRQTPTMVRQLDCSGAQSIVALTWGQGSWPLCSSTGHQERKVLPGLEFYMWWYK